MTRFAVGTNSSMARWAFIKSINRLCRSTHGTPPCILRFINRMPPISVLLLVYHHMSMLCMYLQIAWVIIERVPVNVMDYFCLKQFSSNFIFENNPCPRNLNSINLNPSTIFRNPTFWWRRILFWVFSFFPATIMFIAPSKSYNSTETSIYLADFHGWYGTRLAY